MSTDARNRIWPAILALGVLLLSATARAEPLLALQTWQTDNGAEVLFYPTDSLPMVDARVIFDAGSARDPEGRGGTASLTASLLEEGTTKRDAKAIADGFARVGAEFSASANLESTAVRLRSLTETDWLWPAVELMAEVIAQPAFEDGDIQRERARQLRGIQSRQQSPQAVASDALRKAAFGDHPYAHPTDGTRESVESIDPSDVRAFHQQWFVAANATVVIVGDLDIEQARRLADTLTGGLPTGESAPILPEVPPLQKSDTVRIDFPSEQSTVLVALDGIARKHEDYLPLYVGNHMLGGSGFASRLMSELREKRGLAYSTYSYLMPLRAGGRLVMGIQTRNDQVDTALTLMNEELSRFIDEGPTSEELADSQANIVGGFPMRLNSNGKIIEQIGALAFLDLPLDYFDDYTDRIEAVTAEEIRQAFDRHVEPQKRMVVIVGPTAEKTGVDEGAD
ncbi:pitrilysin family protein [Guyparkeria halophila]|uniref:Pitrilysin family protein n=1 Tax=Guyparkeria halophila TaxID=47960 RepID=A0ABZ0Z0I8_9GAMM|nr:pitrilysin family protein [Guyparkeria halophila]WQH17289.1 pitrilysin family protein [Guyparkeria halophila]